LDDKFTRASVPEHSRRKPASKARHADQTDQGSRIGLKQKGDSVQTYKGSCECGDVRFVVTGTMRDIIACHCEQCRKSSGHYWASTNLDKAQVEITHGRTLTWFQSTDAVRKGFCRTCGSSLFWKIEGQDRLSISAGAFDSPLPVRLTKHIFVSEKRDYYDITDDLPQADQFDLPPDG